MSRERGFLKLRRCKLRAKELVLKHRTPTSFGTLAPGEQVLPRAVHRQTREQHLQFCEFEVERRNQNRWLKVETEGRERLTLSRVHLEHRTSV